jgi:hypothetical protein
MANSSANALVVLAMTATALLFTSASLRAQTFAAAPISRVTAKVADNVVCRTSSNNSVADMPDMSRGFVQGGTTPEEVIVSFTGTWPKPSSGTPAGAFILLEIDGSRVDLTSTNGGLLAHEGKATSVSNGTHGFTFVTQPIAPGRHVAKIRWFDNFLNGTGTICVAERSLVIHHQ